MPDDGSGHNEEQGSTQALPADQPFAPLPDRHPAQSSSDQEMKREVKDIDDRVKRAERWMIGLTIAIAFFALCSVVVGLLQWSAMRGQLAEMRGGGVDTHDLAVATKQQATASGKQADRLKELTDRTKDQAERTKLIADEAKTSAIAAQSIAKTARDAIEQVQRAFIYWKGFDERFEGDTPQSTPVVVVFSPTWENEGVTPAIVLKDSFGSSRLHGEPTEDEFIGTHPDRTSSHEGLLRSPKAPFKGAERAYLYTELSWRNIIAGLFESPKNATVFWGWVAYRDAFKETPIHLTEFCQALTRTFPATDPSSRDHYSFWACGHHNCADEYCQDYKQITEAVRAMGTRPN